MMKLLASLLVVSGITNLVAAQINTAAKKLLSPKDLPGKGIVQYDFFYAGEAKTQDMYIVKKGEIVWAYHDTAKGEISDAILMTNGNVLFAHQYGITLINATKKILWHYDAPKGHEIHTAQPIGKKHILYVENGDTGRVKVVHILTGETVKEFMIPIGNSKSVHGQFRHARLTKKGTLLVSHMDMGLVNEYNFDGQLINSVKVPDIWGAEPLDNGNFLVNCKGSVKEMTPAGDTAWILPYTDLPDYVFNSPQLAIRRPNGNIVFNTWFSQWNGKTDSTNLPVQFVEVTPDKKITWALRSWTAPQNLGPATIIQFLDDRRISEHVFFGKIK
ncbi:MAG: hypothetical protein ABIX01_02010 [Chitinophagaceae bacterium]